MDLCELADTGLNQATIIGIAGAVVLLALTLFYLQRRFGIKTFVLLLGLTFGLALAAAPTSVVVAQSAEDCPPAAQDEDGGSSPQTLGLVDDQGVMALPDDENTQTVFYLALLPNDTAPDDDPIDWETIDLDPNTAGLQTSFNLYHPEDGTLICGTVTVGSFGVLVVTLRYTCWDEDILENDTIPSDFTIAPFTYTAQTVGGNPAPAPATVTILVVAGPEPGVVVAQNDQDGGVGGVCSFEGFTLNLVSNDSTTAGTIDPTTVDLNPGLPGLQKTVTLPHEESVFQASVNSSGVVTVTRLSGSDNYPPIFYYTVQNTNGDVSNVAAILYECHIVT